DRLPGGDHKLYRLGLVLGRELPAGASHPDHLPVDDCPLWTVSTRSGTVHASMRVGSRSQIGSASWTLLSRWWRRSRLGWYWYAASTSASGSCRSLVMRG